MPRYKVRNGQTLPHGGQLLDAGTILELPRHVGTDSVVRDFVQEVDAAGEPVTSGDPGLADLERFRPHERVGMLETLSVEAKARLVRLEALIAEQQDIIDDAITAPAPVSVVHAPEGEE